MVCIDEEDARGKTLVGIASIEEDGLVRHFRIHPEHWRRGYGTKLLAACEEYGAKHINVAAHNIRGVRFMEAMRARWRNTGVCAYDDDPRLYVITYAECRRDVEDELYRTPLL